VGYRITYKNSKGKIRETIYKSSSKEMAAKLFDTINRELNYEIVSIEEAYKTQLVNKR